MCMLNLIVLLCVIMCNSEEDLGYKLNIGNGIDIFKDFGHLSEVIQVMSTNFAGVGNKNNDLKIPFNGNDVSVFSNVTFTETKGGMGQIQVLLGDNFNELLDKYFTNFKIEGLDKPRQAFIGQFTNEHIMRTYFGIENNDIDCCFVLLQLTKVHKTVKLGDIKDIPLKESVMKAIEDLNITDTSAMAKFVRSYGTHYIDSYMTGNTIYQLFKHKRRRFNRLKSYINEGSYKTNAPARVHSYFSSFSLEKVSDIKTASGNKTIENWTRINLRDIQYLQTKASILRLSDCHPAIVRRLENMMDGQALVGLSLKSIKRLFKDKSKADLFAEIFDNHMYLWELNL